MTSSPLRKTLLILIKYIPIVQMMGMFINNTMYYFEINNSFSYCLDFALGNSIVCTFLILVCSYVFNFCKWHRFIILGNFINLVVANLDAIIKINIEDIYLLLLCYFISGIFIIFSTITHLSDKTYGKSSITNNKRIA